MKKLLNLLITTGLLVGSSASAVSCSKGSDNKTPEDGLIDLESLVGNNKDLGQIGNRARVSKEDIIKEFVKKYLGDSGLKEQDLEVVEKSVNNNQIAKVRAKRTSKKFTGEVKVNYEIKKINLESIVGNENNLGEIKNQTEKEIIHRFVETFKEKEDLLKEQELEAVFLSESSAMVKAKASSKFFTGQEGVSFSVEKITLSSLVEQSNNGNDLGPINRRNMKDDILNKFVKQYAGNSGLTVKNLDIKSKLSDYTKEATICAKDNDEKFTGEVKVTFSFEKINLDEIVGKLNFIGDVGADGNVEEVNVIDAFVNKFKDLDKLLTIDDLEINSIDLTNSSAFVRAKWTSKNFIGEVKVTFRINKILLETLVGNNNNLGQVGKNATVNERDIVKKFVKVYAGDSGLKEQDLKVFIDKQEIGKAIVKAKSSSKKIWWWS